MATSKTLTPTNVTIQIPEFTDQPDQRVNSNCIDKEADAINSLNGNINDLFNSDTAKKIGETYLQLKNLKYFRVRSDFANGWVLQLIAEDSAGKTIQIGFDKNYGIYCYYDGTQQWRIAP